MRETFDSSYPEADFRNLHISIDFPVAAQDYPGLWVDWEPISNLQIAGIDHSEYSPLSVGGTIRKHTRWTYQGNVSYTVVALSSMERDRLFDEIIKIIAFGKENASRSVFRSTIEDNDLIACELNFDQIGVGGMTATPGTPWETDEIIYEATVFIGCLGEFVSDDQSGLLVPLSEVVQYAQYVEGDPEPSFDGWQ